MTDFCKICEPLRNLTRNNVPFVWDENCQKAFEVLKQKLINSPLLAYPRFDGTKFILQTDASGQGLGFILAQIHDGNEKVISYGGRALQPPERNYTTTELEALAVVEGINKYAPYLPHGVKFTVVTDHCALKWLFNNKQTTRRLTRWALQLQAYKFDVIHIRGRNNSNADALSRLDYASLDNCQDCNYCHSNPTSEQVENIQLNSELSKLADDVMQDPSDIQCNTKPIETVTLNLLKL